MKDKRPITMDAGVSPTEDIHSRILTIESFILYLSAKRSFSAERGRTARRQSLLQVRNQTEILVSVVEVLAAHTPDESVVVGSGCAMDRPLR